MNRFLRLGGHNCRSAEFINKLILAKEAKNLDVGESVFSETSSDKKPHLYLSTSVVLNRDALKKLNGCHQFFNLTSNY